MLAHWDDVEGYTISEDRRPLGGHWQRLADAAGSVRVGMQRVTVEAGQMMTPPHTHSAEEGDYGGISKRLGAEGGARRSGLKSARVDAERRGRAAALPRSSSAGSAVIARLGQLDYFDGEPGVVRLTFYLRHAAPFLGYPGRPPNETSAL